MTHSLKNYYQKLVKNNTPILVSPMTVEPERFADIKNVKKENCKYIAYAGYLGGKKDGIQNLIMSYEIFLSRISEDVKLYLIGYSEDNNELLRLKTLTQKLGIEDKIVFTGKIHRDKIPYYLCGASLLVLSRPDNKQAQGGFPTKLGEYLATGNPVLVTKVGDIQKYLTDQVNVFLAEPNDIEDFAAKMLFIFENFQFAKIVAAEGRKLVYNVFNYRVQAKRMIEFLFK